MCSSTTGRAASVAANRLRKALKLKRHRVAIARVQSAALNGLLNKYGSVRKAY